MEQFLFDVHQRADNSWRWHGCGFGVSDRVIVSRRGWQSRPEAIAALTRFLEVVGLRQCR